MLASSHYLTMVFSLLLLLPTTSLSYKCVNNEDCPGISPCCSGWGWCVGQGSGGSQSSFSQVPLGNNKSNFGEILGGL